MTNSNSTNSQSSPNSGAPKDLGLSPWQRLKGKRISYLTLPLLVMATVVEFVILATGFRYQQMVCLPSGMGVTFLGIGPIGATILAVELLKLPLAAWTASRHGWQKGFMLIVGLPLICLLTFQLVKDMAVYEMGAAMTPASQYLEKAAAEETKITHLNAELANQTKDDGAVKATIDEKKADRDRKLAELTTKQTKAKSELEESLKRNDAARQDAISLTDYQKKELSEVDARQATLIKQFDADSAQLTKSIAELRARRELELPRATKWNAEEARIENAYKAKMSDYTNKKTTYEKDKAEYESANFLKRQLLREPVDPGVPPVRESNTILKPAEIAELDSQIKTKEAELLAVNNKRRDSVAQVGTDARQLREEFDRRSGTKREETDRKREELLAALALVAKEGATESKRIDQEFEAAVQKQEATLRNQRPLEVVRAELDASRKKAEGFYEAREEAIKNTQVHRIATTVEIVRGLLLGERPMSIKANAKERGDVYTDQISMVRIWVYPVLAFIVAFLPTLMVEIGFSTLFQPATQRPQHRVGFLGRRLHWLYTRAGRLKILRAQRLASEASAEIAARNEALAATKASAEKALARKEAELKAAQTALGVAAAEQEDQLRKKEEAWVAKLAGMADSLNRTVVEKDALRDLQKSEIERQIQMRQNAWSDRLTQLRQELDDQRAASEAERTALLQEHHKKLLDISEDSKTQVIQVRRQMADAEMAAVEASAKLAHDLKEALQARDTAEAQLKHQADSLTLKLSQAKEDAAREMEKGTRQEKHRLDRQQLEFEKTLRQKDEDLEHLLKQREQESSLAFDARLLEEKARVEQDARRREAELERELETRSREVDTRWNQELEQRENAAHTRLKQREQQLQAQAEVRLRDVQARAEEELRSRELEFKRQLDARSRETETRLTEESQKEELAFHAKLKQREQELTSRAAARETELKNQWAADVRARAEEWERQAEARVRATETRLTHEAQQKEENFQLKVRQREHQIQSQFETRQAELQLQWEQGLRRRDMELAEAKQREQALVAKLATQAEAHELANKELETELVTTRYAIDPLKTQLVRTEKERDEAKQAASGAVNQMQALEKKLTEASSFLSGWKNGKQLVEAGR